MEGEQEDSDEDVHEERKTTLLWEKCIRQRIVVDLGEDDSLHLSDLQASLALQPSHAESSVSEASIHFSGESHTPHSLTNAKTLTVSQLKTINVKIKCRLQDIYLNYN